VLPTDEHVHDPYVLRQLVEQEHVTHMDRPPSVYSIAHEKPSCPRRFLDTDAKRTDYICVICEICVICVQHLVAAGSRVMHWY
jgi:hypothetical protein